MDRDRDKRCAADRALDYVESGMTVGLGTGTTASYFVEMLGAKVRRGLRIRAVATSTRTRQLAADKGIPLVTFADVDRLDLTIDGADEIDSRLDCIKGGGGALLHEKIVAAASDKVVIIADADKEVELLGARPIPVEVVPFGWPVTSRWLKALGATQSLRRASGQPFRSEENNIILDCQFPMPIDLAKVAEGLQRVPGMAGHGLFLGLVDIAVIGDMGSVRVRQRPADAPRVRFSGT